MPDDTVAGNKKADNINTKYDADRQSTDNPERCFGSGLSWMVECNGPIGGGSSRFLAD
jgi:hypothetical protein